ncbi:hypothetical protein F4777DRAFT_128382 [Nemania sp. FL0916]|nr:hypothetical protein F4777DRAFT_128382 [Nemania sp. FL0916]
MPYSDNMYSMGDDSDGEDYADHLSPSDGQFPASSSNITPHVPNILLPDPTLEQDAERRAESKAQEASEEGSLYSQAHPSQPSSQPDQTPIVTSTSPPRQPSQVTRSQAPASQYAPPAAAPTPSRSFARSVYSEAPPAYSPSPVSPISSGGATAGQQEQQPRSYNTFGTNRNMGASALESERLLGPQPESMGGPADGGYGRPAWVRRASRRVSGWFSWKYAVLAFAVLIATMVLLSKITPSRHDGKGGDDVAPIPTMPPVDKEPETPVHDVPERPSDPPPPGSSFQPGYCDGKLHRYEDRELSLEFTSSQNLTFKETVYQQPGSTRVRVSGRVDVRRLEKGGGNPRMSLEVVTNEPELQLYTSLDADLQEIKISVPEKYDNTVSGQQPCIEMRGTIWVPKDADIGSLSVHAVHLGILLFDDLSLRVVDHTELSSIVGHITAGASDEDVSSTVLSDHDYSFIPAKDSWAFDSRIIDVRTTTGNIDGNWPLYDDLGLHTTSGDIDVSITPKEELESNPKPAVLSLSTISGVITATEPIHSINQIPQRDYRVDLKSTAGNFRGWFAFSADITMRSTSGTVRLDLLPVINTDIYTPKNLAELETTTISGDITVVVLDPVLFQGGRKAKTAYSSSSDIDTRWGKKDRTLDCLSATHRSTSGNIKLVYPQSWEGKFYASTTSGRLIARGKDLKILSYRGMWPGSGIEAQKGGGGKKSTIEVHSIMGNMDALVGDEF